MKHKPIVSAEEKHLFASGFRVKQGDYEFVTYPENTSVRCWHREEPDDYEAHFHSAIEVHLPLRGEVVCCADQVEYHTKAGEVLIIPAGCNHDLHMAEGSERELILYEPNGVFSMKEFSALRQMVTRPIHITAAHPKCDQVRNLLLELIRIHRASESMRNMHCYAIILEIYALLAEEYLNTVASAAERNALNRQLSGEDAFNRAVEYVDHNYVDDLTLDTLADHAGFSRYTLSRMFRQHTGVTFTRYLSRKRVEMAQELLSGTRMPVTQVALQCGFNSIATFNRVFRDVKGCAPTQYRDIYAQEN